MITAEELQNILDNMAKAIYKILCPIPLYPYKRSLYLAAHGNPRVRKKNARRYFRWYMKHYINK